MQINRMTEPTHKGRHPEYTHLVFIEADPYYDKYKIRTPAIPGASTLMNEWDLKKQRLVISGMMNLETNSDSFQMNILNCLKKMNNRKMEVPLCMQKI